MSIEPVYHKKEAAYPSDEAEMTEITDTLAAIRNHPGEILVVNLLYSPFKGAFLQVTRMEDADPRFHLELWIGNRWNRPKMLCRRPLSMEETLEVLREICVRGVVPSEEKWEDVTEELFGTATMS